MQTRRYPLLAVLLALCSPLFGMLYLGRPWRGISYHALAFLAFGLTITLASHVHWPTGVGIWALNGIVVLGDNRDNSEDSRYWGFVPEQSVVGPAFLIFWNDRLPERAGLSIR